MAYLGHRIIGFRGLRPAADAGRPHRTRRKRQAVLAVLPCLLHLEHGHNLVGVERHPCRHPGVGAQRAFHGHRFHRVSLHEEKSVQQPMGQLLPHPLLDRLRIPHLSLVHQMALAQLGRRLFEHRQLGAVVRIHGLGGRNAVGFTCQHLDCQYHPVFQLKRDEEHFGQHWSGSRRSAGAHPCQ